MAKYDVQGANGYAPNQAYIPGNINQPVIFIPPSSLSVGSGEIWIAASNTDTDYGGCVIWASLDNTTFHRVGKLYGSSIAGILTATLPASGTTIDTTNTASIRINGDRTMAGVSQQSVDTYHSLCLVGNEFLAYRNATLTSTSGELSYYNLTNLRRGLYGSVSGGVSGNRFAFLNDTIFKYRFKQELVGATIYFKFQAFNSVESGLQKTSGLTSYPFTISSDGGVKAIIDDVNAVSTNVTTAQTTANTANTTANSALSAANAIRIRSPLNASVTGVTATKIGALRLPAGSYSAPIANIGCAVSTHTATLEFRSGATVLATISGASAVTWRAASSGFTLAADTGVDLFVYGSLSSTVVNLFSIVV